MDNRGQFSIIASLLVLIVLVGTLITVFATIRYDSSENQSPQVLTAADETNSAILKALGFTVGYYGSILQVTGNQTYAYANATTYMDTALQYIESMNPSWGEMISLTTLNLTTNWFSNPSISTGQLSVVYDLTNLGIYGINYTTSCSLGVQIFNSPSSNQVCLNVTQDSSEPLTSLGQQNFAFYSYNYLTSNWQLENPSLTPLIFANGTYLINIPSGIDSSEFMVQVTDSRGIMVEASSYNSYNFGFTFGTQSMTQNSPVIVELLQNGTMRWFDQDIVSVTKEQPIPPVSVKSLNLCQTGSTSEIPFQVEDWASQYQIPLGLTSNYTIFSNSQMVVFEVSPSVSQLTLWWNGSDTAIQPSAAYTDISFTGDNSGAGTLSNGKMTLQFSYPNSVFTATSSIGGVSSTLNFMRINGDDSTYGSGSPAYVIQNGVVRDIVQEEAEWGNGPTNCPNVYSQIVLTLPANANYFTYQLRLIFINSGVTRTISDISPLQLTLSVGQVQAMTENGTTNGIPNVSESNGYFNNSLGNAHHWSQLVNVNNNLQGTGVMFTDSANQQLYAFDSMAGKFTGALYANGTTPTIELDPVTSAGPVSFTSAMDLTWYGAIATFYGANPIYSSGGNSGLWSLAEQPPTVAVTSESSSAASIGLSSSSGPAGTSVTVSGGGFIPQSQITITFNGNTVTSATATAYGTIPSGTAFIIPSSASGSYTVNAKDTSSNSALASFTVTPEPTETITFQSSGISGAAGSATILTIDSVQYIYSSFPISFSWQATSTHTITASSTIGVGTGKQYAWISWSSGGAQTQSYTVPQSSATITASYNTQYQVTFNYQVTGGGSGYFAPSVTYYQSGSQLSVTAGPSATVWVDSGSTYTYTNNPLSGSGASERWYASSGASGTISSSTAVNPTYYNQYSVTFGYSDQDSSAITSGSQIGSYYQFGSALTINSGSSYGSTSPVSDWVDAGSGTMSYQTSTSGSQSWALSSSPATFSVSSSSTISDSNFYHQYKVTASYSSSDSSTPSAGVILSGTQFGSSSYTLTLTKSAQTTWLDAVTGWSVNNPITSGSQRWDATSGTSGTATGAVTVAPSYYDQYSVTPYFTVSDSSSPTVTNVVSYTAFGSAASATPTKGSSGGSVVWVDAGSAVKYSSPIAGSGERWQVSSTDSGTYTALSSVSSSTTAAVEYYDQYSVTPYFTVSDSSSPTVTNVVSYTAFGSAASATPTKGSSGGSVVWVDAGSAVKYSSPIAGSSERWQVSSTDSGTYTALSSVSSSTTAAVEYYDQYQVSAKYSTSDGTTPSSSVTLSATQFGSALPTTNLGTTNQNLWLDAGTGWSVNSLFTSGTQRWDAASGTSGTVSSSTTITPSYYHQCYQTLSYVVIDGGSPSAPTAAGTSLGSAYAPSLTTSATGYWFDASGSIAISTSTGTNEQWAPSPASVSATSANTLVVSMYNQYKVTASYSTSDGSTPSASVILSGTQFGSSGYTLTLTKVAQTTWLDNGTGWSVTNPVTSGSQRWNASSGTSGTLTGAVAVAPIYNDQYQVTFSQTGVGGAAGSNAVLAVGSTNYVYNALPSGVWVNSGTTFGWVSTVSGGTGTQFVESGSSGSSPISGSGTFSATYTTQYYLTMSSAYGGPTGQGWYNSGSLASFAVTTPSSGGTGTQYVFTSWNGSGNGAYNGTSSSQSISMNNPITEIASWVTQYYLTVNSAQSTTTGQAWYNSGATAYAGVNSATVSGGTGTQYAFTSWSGAASGSNYAQSNAITMNGPLTATANWVTQYYLTVTSTYGSPTGQGWYTAGAQASFSVNTPASGGTGTQYVLNTWSGSGSGAYSGSSSSSAVTMNNPLTETATWVTQYYLTVNSAQSTTTGQAWYNSGATAYAGVNSATVSGGTGTQYAFTSWSGAASGSNYAQSNAITMNGPLTATANWVTQYYLTVTSTYGSPTGQGWYTAGAQASFSVNTPASGGTGTQYVLNTWSGSGSGAYSGSSSSSAVTMNNPLTETATWVTQYYLTVNSAQSTTTGQAWYNSGATAYAGVNSATVSGGTGTQYAFTSWSGAASGSNYAQSNAITMNGPLTATANWKTQYQVTFDASSSVKGDSSATIVTVASNGKTGAQLPYTAWYDSGSSLTYSFVSPVTSSSSPSSTRYQWSSTNGLSQTLQSSSFTVSGTGTVNATYTTQTFGIDPNCEGSGSGSSKSISTTLMTAQSNELILVEITGSSNSLPISSVKDSFGITYNPEISYTTSSGVCLYVYYAFTGANTGQFSITVQVSSKSVYDIQAFGITGANTASPFDANSYLPREKSSSNSIPTVSSVYTSNANDMILAFEGQTSNTPSQSAGSSFSATGLLYYDSTRSLGDNTEYKIVNSTQSGTSVSFGTSVSSSWIMAVGAVQRAW